MHAFNFDLVIDYYNFCGQLVPDLRLWSVVDNDVLRFSCKKNHDQIELSFT